VIGVVHTPHDNKSLNSTFKPFAYLFDRPDHSYLGLEDLLKGRGSPPHRVGHRLNVVRYSNSVNACVWVNHIFTYYRRGWIFRDRFAIIFEGSAVDYLLDKFDGRVERIFRKVFPNGRLIINSRRLSELSRRDCVDMIVSKGREVTYVTKRRLVKLKDRLITYGMRDMDLDELEQLIKGDLSRFFELGVRGLTLEDLKRLILQSTTKKRYRGKLGSLKSIFRRLKPLKNSKPGRTFRVHFTFYVSIELLTEILLLIPRHIRVILSCSPSIYALLSKFVKEFMVERAIGQHPRFWSRYMLEWVKHQIYGNGLRFSEVSALIFKIFGYRVSAKRLAVRFWLEWKGKGPPI